QEITAVAERVAESGEAIPSFGHINLVGPAFSSRSGSIAPARKVDYKVFQPSSTTSSFSRRSKRPPTTESFLIETLRSARRPRPRKFDLPTPRGHEIGQACRRKRGYMPSKRTSDLVP